MTVRGLIDLRYMKAAKSALQERAVFIAAEVLLALKFMHEQAHVVYRDLKTEVWDRALPGLVSRLMLLHCHPSAGRVDSLPLLF